MKIVTKNSLGKTFVYNLDEDNEDNFSKIREMLVDKLDSLFYISVEDNNCSIISPKHTLINKINSMEAQKHGK